jgi:predicted small metal-binding protein
MMTLACKDMGSSCDYVAKGETREAVMDDMKKHAVSEHKEMMEKMSEKEKDEMMVKMDEMIKEE